MPDRTLDTLPEFHMQNPDDAVYALMAHLLAVLEMHNQNNIQAAYQNVSNILGEVEANRMMHVICQIMHVDYLALMQDCQQITLQHVSPRLLLHLAILPVPFVSNELQIDQYWAAQLLDQLHKHFTIDDPILWLKRLLTITEQEHQRYKNEYENLLHGGAITGTPKDTAEYRRSQQYHRLRQDFKPGTPH